MNYPAVFFIDSNKTRYFVARSETGIPLVTDVNDPNIFQVHDAEEANNLNVICTKSGILCKMISLEEATKSGS